MAYELDIIHSLLLMDYPDQMIRLIQIPLAYSSEVILIFLLPQIKIKSDISDSEGFATDLFKDVVTNSD